MIENSKPILKRLGFFAFKGAIMDYDLKVVRKAYYSHKAHAKQRAVEFKLTFEQWWGIWKPFFHNRGPGKHQFVMCRTMDKGPYEIGNVRIDTVEGNANSRRVVAHDKKMKSIQDACVEGVIDSYDDADSGDEGWLPRELRNPYHSFSNNYGMK